MIKEKAFVLWESGDHEVAIEQLQGCLPCRMEDEFEVRKTLCKWLDICERYEEIKDHATKCLQHESSDVEVLSYQARACYKTRMYKDALFSIQTLASHGIQNIQLLTYMEDSYKQIGDLKSALQTCNAILSEDPDMKSILHEKALLLVAMKRFQDAHTAFKKYWEISGMKEWKDMVVFESLLEKIGQKEERLECLFEMMRIRPQNVEIARKLAKLLCDSGKTKESIELYEKLLDRIDKQEVPATPSDVVDVLKCLGRHYESIGNSNRALLMYERLLLVDKLSSETWYRRGRIQYDKNMFHEASESFSEAIKIDDRHAKAHYHRGMTLIRLERLEDAVRELDACLSHDINMADAWFQKSLLLTTLDRLSEAVSSWTNYLKLCPSDASAWCNQGVCFLKMDQPKGAVLCFDECLSYAPSHEFAMYNKCVALWMDGTLAESLDCFDAYLEMCKEDAHAWINRGIVLGELNRLDDADASYRTGLSLDPYNSMGWYNLGVCETKRSRHAEAALCFDRSVELDGTVPMSWASRGAAYAAMGNSDEARRSFERLKELDPNHAWAKVFFQDGELPVM
eukprot:TRINITY_DN1449_c0_g1_i2.p2 TRINITY_DN1449_c0_g1~~TRINITY_DN1449_c0_g1_i2.p2  ORF type:complete len:569 (+),score=155.93 TRINITY_DN1449_c0_g1_i2:2046-3752(+)